MNYNSYLDIAIDSALEAGKAILSIYKSSDFDIKNKSNNSPLTLADLASNEKIMEGLNDFDLPMINEEAKNQDYDLRKDYEHYWIIDPLDGTKEFIKKNGEFTVNIALGHKNKLIFGVIYVPVSRELYFANVPDQEAYKATLDKNHRFHMDMAAPLPKVNMAKNENTALKIVGSRSHMNEDTKKYVESLIQNGNQVEIVSKGSSLKFCLVAEGKADIYPRFAPTMEWDTAAGQAICSALGIKVIDQKTGKEMEYNKPNLLNNYFLVSH